jgi:hypothetical protein
MDMRAEPLEPKTSDVLRKNKKKNDYLSDDHISIKTL